VHYRHISAILAVVLVSSACVGQRREITARDVEVLQAVLSHRCADRSSGYSVLYSESVDPQLYAPPMGWWTARRQAARQMVRRGRSPQALPVVLTCSRVKIVSSKSIEAAFRLKAPPTDPPNPGWEGFHASFPGATSTLALSLPGYSFTGNTACVYIGGSSGGLAGAGWFIYLKRQHGKWIPFDREMAWIS